MNKPLYVIEDKNVITYYFAKYAKILDKSTNTELYIIGAHVGFNR